MVWLNTTSGLAIWFASSALRLRLHRGERGRIGARLRESQVQELEHRLEILRRAPAAHALVDLVDERRDGDRFAGEDLVEHHGAEPPDAAGGDDGVRDAGGNEIGVARERCPSRRRPRGTGSDPPSASSA